MAKSTKFKKGCVPWNKGLKGFNKGHPCYNNGKTFLGRKHSEESKRKMSEAKKGKVGNTKGKTWKVNLHKLLNYGKIKGEKHWNWKGGVTSVNSKLRSSTKFKAWRELVFERDNYTCQRLNCKYCKNVKGVELHPHHVFKLSKFKHLVFNTTNGITLCKDAHMNLHGLGV